MAGEANAAAFEGGALKSNYDTACGAYTQPDGRAARNGGILLPNKSRLQPGTILYRFGSLSKPEAVDQNGRWWILDTTFDLYAATAATPDMLAQMARQNLAVADEFSAMDRLIKASVARPVLVFSGVGSGYFGPGTGKISLLGGTELNGSSLDQARKYQFCIPDLWNAKPAALTVQWTMPVTEWFRMGKPG